MDTVLLRNVRPSDLPIFFEQQRDPDAVRMAAFFSRDKDAFDAHWVKILADPNCLIRAIEFEGQVAGNVGSWDHEGIRHVGYWLGQEFWGKGIATQALKAFLKLDARSLQARVAKTNLASIRVLEKCGFSVIGDDRPAVQPGREQVEEWIYELRAKSD